MEKNFINARIKTLRKALKLNQTEFGEKIGLKNGAISWMEKEGNTVTAQNIKLICEKFHVRREWLTEGTGEMMQETEDSLFASFAQRYELSSDDQNVARYLLGLSSEERQMVKQHVLELADAIRRGQSEVLPLSHKEAPSPSLEEQEAEEIAAIREKYRAKREGQNVSNSDTSPAALPVDPAIEEKTAKFRARLYAQDKTRRILTGSAATENTSADENMGK